MQKTAEKRGFPHLHYIAEYDKFLCLWDNVYQSRIILCDISFKQMYNSLIFIGNFDFYT